MIGQLPNATGTTRVAGNPAQMIGGWLSSLTEVHLLAVLFTLGTIVCVLSLRHFTPRLPASLIALGLSIGVARVFQLSDAGLHLVADLAPLPAGLPPLTVPHLDQWAGLLPTALACAVLSLVESSSLARTLAARSGQRLDMAANFRAKGWRTSPRLSRAAIRSAAVWPVRP